MEGNRALKEKLFHPQLAFEPNEGQTDSLARFIARGKNYELLLGPTQAAFSSRSNPSSIRMQFAGANKNAAIEGAEKSQSYTNYFMGKDPKKWHTGIPSYKNVKVHNLYDGIDLLYYGNDNELEHDLVVAPQKDPAVIKISFEEADSLEVTATGDLIVKSASGQLRLKKPNLSQRIGDSNQAVQGGYVLRASNEVGFQIGKYDVNKPLIIDPVLEFSTYLGGNEEDVIIGMAVDPNGNIYVAGGTGSTNFPLKNAFQSTVNPNLCVTAPVPMRCGSGFISKFNPTGDSLIYSTYFGGTGTGGEAVRSISVDAQGNVYAIGLTTASDFPTTPGAYSTQYTAGTCSGFVCREGFVTKFAPSGSALIYSTYLGAPGDSFAWAGAVDSLGQVYVSGTTSSSSFPTTPGAFQTSCTLLTPPAPQQCSVAFVAALNASGSALVYSTYFGDNTTGGPIAVDGSGNAVFAGSVAPGSLPLVNALQTQPAPGYFAKLKPDGSGLLFSSYLGGTTSGTAANEVSAGGLALDGLGNIYITGSTSSLNFPTTPGAFQESVTSTGGYFGFVSKIDKSGSAPFIYSTYLAGQSVVNPVSVSGTLGIAVDSAGQAYVIGGTNQSDFPQVNSLLPSYAAGPCVDSGSYQCTHAFISELNSQGTGLVFSTFLGGSNVDNGFAIAVDQFHSIYAAGQTNSTDFPVVNAFQATPGGGTSCANSAPCFDGFVAKIRQPGLIASLGSLAFPLQLVGTQSSAQQITITNTSTQSIQIISIAAVGDFSESDGCVGTLASGANCTINVFFNPTAAGQRTGSLTLTDNGLGGPINIPLAGQGSAPAASISPDAFSFIPVSQGATEGPVPFTLTSNGTAPLHVSSVAFSGANPGDFSQTNSCVGTAIAVNATCTINVSNTPQAEGARSAILVVTDDAVVPTQSVSLQATGTAPFAMAPAANSSATATITAGQTANYSLQLNPGKGFTGSVSLGCAGAPTASTCSVSPASINVSSASPANITVSVSTTGSANAPISFRSFRNLPFAGLRFYPAVAALFIFLLLIWMHKGQSALRKLSTSAAASAFVILLFASGCGGGSTTTSQLITPKGNYTITVSGTANNLPTQSISLTLTVN